MSAFPIRLVVKRTDTNEYLRAPGNNNKAVEPNEYWGWTDNKDLAYLFVNNPYQAFQMAEQKLPASDFKVYIRLPCGREVEVEKMDFVF